MQSFEDYRNDFLQDVKATEESEANGTVASFVKICALKLFEGDVLPEYTPCYYNGPGYRNANLRVDGYALDDADDALYLLTAAYAGDEGNFTLQGSDAKSRLDCCRAFAENSIEHDLAGKIEISTEAYDLAALIQDQKQYISKIVVILLTDMSLSDRAVLTDSQSKSRGKSSGRKRTSVLSAEPISGIEVEYRIWDMPRFHRIFSAGDGHEEIEIEFFQYTESGIPCLAAGIEDEKSECKSYLCTVPGNVIADLYDEYGSRILEGNVRSFLGRKTSMKSVNGRIRYTILNEPEKFFVYNNGLATTATDITVENGHLIFARDLQIVNGGQTTASLSAVRHKDNADLSKVSVLMKLTQVNPERAAEIVPEISKSANSQNKINPADFFSTHEYHIRMEQISRRKFAPAKEGAQHETHWFYERARGQYTQSMMLLSKAQEKKFMTQNPKDQVITKTDLAKVLNSWDELPYFVSKGAESNFDKFANRITDSWETKKDDYNDNYFQEAIALVIIFKTIDKLIPKQAWYVGGYKANIVSYTVAYLHHFIQTEYPGQDLDLQRIWQKQKCSEALISELIIIAEKVYLTITSPSRPIDNVTQWCKQSACWDQIKKMKVPAAEGFETTLISNYEKKEISKDARELRKLENTIDSQTTVYNLGEEYWVRLESWLRSHPLATDAEKRALCHAVQISNGIFPDERQCKSLLLLRDKSVREGFPEKLK